MGEIITVGLDNVDQIGFFCQKSKPKSESYKLKQEWLKERFKEGMAIKIWKDGKSQVGFIEYTPSEFAWRVVEADNYMMVHCLWVVGKNKGKGFGSALLEQCIQDAKKAGKSGVAVVASSHTWLPKPEIFLSCGFEVVDKSPPSFELLVKKFDKKTKNPSFPRDFDEKLKKLGKGLTVLFANQCPHAGSIARYTLEVAAEKGIAGKIIELKKHEDILKLSPSPYGVFAIVYDGKLLSYHYLTKGQLLKTFEQQI